MRSRDNYRSWSVAYEIRFFFPPEVANELLVLPFKSQKTELGFKACFRGMNNNAFGATAVTVTNEIYSLQKGKTKKALNTWSVAWW